MFYFECTIFFVHVNAINLFVLYIFQVPDRGGRAWELEPPPPEMPAFKKRQVDNFSGGKRGAGGYNANRGGNFDNRGRGDYQNCKQCFNIVSNEFVLQICVRN